MTCIKTGAQVFVAEAGCVIAADLYQVGNCVVIRSNPDALRRGNTDPAAPTTHRAFMDMPFAQSFLREDLGVFVINEHQIEEFVRGQN